MDEKQPTNTPPLTPDEREDLKQINQYIGALNGSWREYHHQLSQIAAAYSDRPPVLSFFGKEAINIACYTLYQVVPVQFGIPVAEVGEHIQAIRQGYIESRLEELHKMPYAEYLQTEHWQHTRAESLKRAGYHCQVCNTGKHLHVHHRTYERRGYERDDDLTVLCDKCHQLFHDNGRLEDGE